MYNTVFQQLPVLLNPLPPDNSLVPKQDPICDDGAAGHCVLCSLTVPHAADTARLDLPHVPILLRFPVFFMIPCLYKTLHCT